MTTETEKYPVFQGLMNAAYDTYGNQSYDDFLFNLPAQQRMAVLIGNLNHQVENGGFAQWILNGYSNEAQEVRYVLRKIGTHAASNADNLILIALAAHGQDGYDADLDKQDTAYYSLSDQLLADAESFFANPAHRGGRQEE